MRHRREGTGGLQMVRDTTTTTLSGSSVGRATGGHRQEVTAHIPETVTHLQNGKAGTAPDFITTKPALLVGHRIERQHPRSLTAD
jgi:hypothetical protein